MRRTCIVSHECYKEVSVSMSHFFAVQDTVSTAGNAANHCGQRVRYILIRSGKSWTVSQEFGLAIWKALKLPVNYRIPNRTVLETLSICLVADCINATSDWKFIARGLNFLVNGLDLSKISTHRTFATYINRLCVRNKYTPSFICIQPWQRL